MERKVVTVSSQIGKRNISCAIATDDTIWDILQIYTSHTSQDWIKIWSDETGYWDDDLYSFLFKRDLILNQKKHAQWLEEKHKEFIKSLPLWFRIISFIEEEILTFFHKVVYT